MREEFEKNDIQSTFDFRGFLLKLLSFWPYFLISLAIAFSIAFYINVRKLPIYSMENMISIKDDQNPFFTSNTSLTFNWGGTTDKVNTAVITLRSRSHNEKVVDRLQYYINYQRDGKYQKVDAYQETPFFVSLDTSKAQVLWREMQIIFKDSTTFTLETNIEVSRFYQFQYFNESKKVVSQYLNAGMVSKMYHIGDIIDLPFFHGTLFRNPSMKVPVEFPSMLTLRILTIL